MGRGRHSQRASGEGGRGWLPATWSLLHGAPCAQPNLPDLPQRGWIPKSVSFSPSPWTSRARPSLGRIPGLSFPSPSAAELPGEGPRQSLSTMETTASYLLLIRTAPPGPAESGCRNVALGQAAPSGSEVLSAVSWGWS